MTLTAKFLIAVAAIAAASSAPAQVQEMPQSVRAAWGFDRSDLPPHPGVRFGVLENGMRYALLRSGSPAGALSARLHIDAGSSVEGEKEQGFMHVVEHMIFHGSANLPEGSLPLMLKHQGLKRWTDFNAYTSFDETVYLLDLSRSDGRARETALTLMREISGNLLFGRSAVEGAKDMVKAEIGERDAVHDRMTTAQHAFFVPGTPLARGPVAGTASSVGRAKGETLERLYRHYYVPERTTLVLVGDFDPALAAAEIEARFGDWRGTGASPAMQPESPTVARGGGVEARLFVDEAAPTGVTIAAVEPLDGAADAGGRRDRQFLEHLGSEMLNRRLARIAARTDAPFAKADSAIYDHFSTARLARIEVAAKDRNWRRALIGGGLELRRALENGFSQSELDAVLAGMRKAGDASPPARTTPALADAILDAVSRGLVFTAPGDPSATAAYLERVRLDDVNAAFKSAWARPGRLIFASHDRKFRNAEAELAAAWAEITRIPLTTP